MAKRAKGEVSFEHDGKSFTLVLDFNAIAEFEDLAGVPNGLAALEGEMKALDGQMSAKTARALFCAGLRGNHPDLTLVEAGRLLTSNVSALNEAMTAAFPKADSTAAGNANPAGSTRRR